MGDDVGGSMPNEVSSFEGEADGADGSPAGSRSVLYSCKSGILTSLDGSLPLDGASSSTCSNKTSSFTSISFVNKVVLDGASSSTYSTVLPLTRWYK